MQWCAWRPWRNVFPQCFHEIGIAHCPLLPLVLLELYSSFFCSRLCWCHRGLFFSCREAHFYFILCSLAIVDLLIFVLLSLGPSVKFSCCPFFFLEFSSSPAFLSSLASMGAFISALSFVLSCCRGGFFSFCSHILSRTAYSCTCTCWSWYSAVVRGALREEKRA